MWGIYWGVLRYVAPGGLSLRRARCGAGCVLCTQTHPHTHIYCVHVHKYMKSHTQTQHVLVVVMCPSISGRSTSRWSEPGSQTALWGSCYRSTAPLWSTSTCAPATRYSGPASHASVSAVCLQTDIHTHQFYSQMLNNSLYCRYYNNIIYNHYHMTSSLFLSAKYHVEEEKRGEKKRIMRSLKGCWRQLDPASDAALVSLM